MKLHLANGAGQNLITGYGINQLFINKVSYQGSHLVMADHVIPWAPSCFEALEAAHFEVIVNYQPEVVLLGTGQHLKFPHPTLNRALIEAGISMEVMDTPAACRTYNILMTEGRKVLLAAMPN